MTAAVTTITGTTTIYGIAVILSFLLQNRNKLEHWIAIFEAVLEARSQLKHYAPTLYSKLFDALLQFYVDSVTPENVAALIGKIVGLGGVALLERKLNVFKTLSSLALSVVLRCLQNVGDSFSRARHLWEQGLPGLKAELAAQGIHLTMQDEAAILRELMAHPKELRMVFERLTHEIASHAQGAK